MLQAKQRQNILACVDKLISRTDNWQALRELEINKSDSFAITGADQNPAWHLELKPKDELLKKIISSIVLSDDNELRLLEIQEAGGDITHIKFAQITHPAQSTSEKKLILNVYRPKLTAWLWLLGMVVISVLGIQTLTRSSWKPVF